MLRRLIAREGRPSPWETVLCLGLWGALAGLAAWLHATDGERYYRLVQEDEALEWATVWFLLLAAGGFALKARLAGGSTRLAPLLLAFFCLALAGEEISWGQRLAGYRPPASFLEHNDQQELNLHNLLPKSMRKVALPAFLLGYGAALPWLASFPAMRMRMRRVGLGAPAFPVAFGHGLAAALYVAYPWRFTGEWVELMLGMALALQAVMPDEARRSTPARSVLRPATACLAVGLLAFGSSAWAREGRRADPRQVAAARLELEALREDFRRGRLRSHCGLHKRLYRHVGREEGLASFSSLVRRGMPQERASFLLDPWNSPYWIRDHCREDGSRRVVLYSLGGNRLRESTVGAVGGDDLILEVASAISPGH